MFFISQPKYLLWCSKEPSPLDGSFEYPQQVFKVMDKKKKKKEKKAYMLDQVTFLTIDNDLSPRL